MSLVIDLTGQLNCQVIGGEDSSKMVDGFQAVLVLLV